MKNEKNVRLYMNTMENSRRAIFFETLLSKSQGRHKEEKGWKVYGHKVQLLSYRADFFAPNHVHPSRDLYKDTEDI